MSLEELELRIKAIEDLEAIKKLHQKYMDRMDTLQYDDILKLFTEDATVEVRDSGIKSGKKDISEIYQAIAKIKGKIRDNAHLVVHPDITVNGDTASGTWLVYMLFCDPPRHWVQGRNECEYRREGDRWKISKLKFTRTLASDPSLYP